jgi:hypothetical protein
MEYEWENHRINVKIDQMLSDIQSEIDFVKASKVPQVHYHRNVKTVCTEEMVKAHGACCGTSPHALLKKTLEQRLADLNSKYPTSPLPEID